MDEGRRKELEKEWILQYWLKVLLLQVVQLVQAAL